jgi:hypothetical protein
MHTTDADNTSPISPDIPEHYWVGQDLHWRAEWAVVDLLVELPFWLMVPTVDLPVEVAGHSFPIGLRDDFIEVQAGEFLDSARNRLYLGPQSGVGPIAQFLLERGLASLTRPCKTVVVIRTRCNSDVLSKAGADQPSSVTSYLQALCAAHLPVVNTVIRAYRLATYDLFPLEVNPWDVPIWAIKFGGQHLRVSLLEYASWDVKPMVFSTPEQGTPFELIDGFDLAAAMNRQFTPGEGELLDGLALMERGDYSGAVRRVVTSIEVVLEAALRGELLKVSSEPEVDRLLKASRYRFPSRLRQYLTLAKRTMPTGFDQELERSRDLRHKIVHRGLQVTYHERGMAQRCVDTGRWIFNWLENQPERTKARESRLGLRSLGRHLVLFDAAIESDGVVVHPLIEGETPESA